VYAYYQPTTRQLTHHASKFLLLLFPLPLAQAVAKLVEALRYNPVAGSILDGVTGIFYRHNFSDRIVTLGPNQPLTKMSTRNISFGRKGGRCVGLTILLPSCVDSLEIWVPQPPAYIAIILLLPLLFPPILLNCL